MGWKIPFLLEYLKNILILKLKTIICCNKKKDLIINSIKAVMMDDEETNHSSHFPNWSTTDLFERWINNENIFSHFLKSRHCTVTPTASVSTGPLEPCLDLLICSCAAPPSCRSRGVFPNVFVLEVMLVQRGKSRDVKPWPSLFASSPPSSSWPRSGYFDILIFSCHLNQVN